MAPKATRDRPLGSSNRRFSTIAEFARLREWAKPGCYRTATGVPCFRYWRSGSTTRRCRTQRLSRLKRKVQEPSAATLQGLHLSSEVVVPVSLLHYQFHCAGGRSFLFY